MDAAVRAAVPEGDVLVMAAAVADYRPAEQHQQKLKKDPSSDELVIRMTKNPDIIAGVSGGDILKIGFAAETESLLDHAAGKLDAKGLDMIVANDAVATIGSDRVAATLLTRGGGDPRVLPEMDKGAFASELIGQIERLLEERGA